jgi:polar amino acid transport system substrate-binding protein
MDDFMADPGIKIGVIKSFRHGKAYDAWLERLRAKGGCTKRPTTKPCCACSRWDGCRP